MAEEPCFRRYRPGIATPDLGIGIGIGIVVPGIGIGIGIVLSGIGIGIGIANFKMSGIGIGIVNFGIGIVGIGIVLVSHSTRTRSGEDILSTSSDFL
jgi:hypothetical protein